MWQISLNRNYTNISYWFNYFYWINNNPAVGIKETVSNVDFTIYPNPSKGDFTISNLPVGSSEVYIYTETGELMKKISTTSTSTEIVGISQGLYMIRINTGTSIMTKQLIVFN